MAYSEEIRRTCRSAYIHKFMSLEAAAQLVNVGIGTARRWRTEDKERGDDWDQARAAARLSGGGAEVVTQAVLEQFVILFQSTINSLNESKDISPLAKAEAISRLSDAYNKTMAAVAKGSPKLNKLAIAMEVIQLLSEFIVNHYPQHGDAFVEILSPFGEHLTGAMK